MIRIRRRPPAGIDGDWPPTMPPLLRRIHAARGSSSIATAQPRLSGLLDPELLGGIERACTVLREAIDADAHILVVGDFDCDGATACAVAVRGLRMLGAKRVSHATPNRMRHGYGLSPGLVDELAVLRPDVLLTVDHGVACHAGVARAKALGWQVVVTDHHLPGQRLPAADAIIDPNLPGDRFPSKALAGVGVVFYLLLALRRRLRAQGRWEGGAVPDLGALLDLVAVGTVADLVILDVNNRALVGAGLRRLRAGVGCPGLRALIEVSGRRSAELTCADIGFAIAPRINAAGRLEDMAVGVQCLLSDDPAQALALAQTLNAINGERRSLQRDMVDAAEAALNLLYSRQEALPAALALFDPSWHPGVVGLVASRIKERTCRPAVVFALTEPNGALLRGSARSIPGLHIRDALAAVDNRHPGLIERFGGHAMAAGLSLKREAFARFRNAWRQEVAALIDPASLQAELWSDGGLSPDQLDRTHAQMLRDGGVWGQGYPEPLFDGRFEVSNWRVVGERHLKLELAQAGRRLNAIQFNGWNGQPPAAYIDIAYRLEPDDWRGGDAVQLIVVHRSDAGCGDS